MKRSEIIRKIENRLKRIETLKAQIEDLKRQNYLHSDRNMQFVEKEEQFLVSRRPKVYETKLVGRVNFKNRFDVGEDGKKEIIVIDRT